MNTVIETYKVVRAIPPDDGLLKEMVADLMKQWLTATRSAVFGSKEVSNTVLHGADLRRLGLIDENGKADLDRVKSVAERVFTAEDVSFDKLAAWVDENLTSTKMNPSDATKKSQAMLKKKRKQGRLNRKRGRR